LARAHEIYGSSSCHPEVDARFAQERLQIQGLAAAVTTVTADQDFGLVKARERAELATSLLRIFDLANLGPTISSHCQPLGMEHIQKIQAYLELTGGGLGYSARILEPDLAPFRISSKELAKFRQLGLDHLDQLLSTEPLTDFQECLLAALLVYSRNSLAKQPIEKLVFILVALESLLLKDGHENVQQNIGERLAFFSTNEPAKRREIVALTISCYNYRSRFLHHGRDEHELEILSDFMILAWGFLLRLIKRNMEFTTKAEFIQAIEEVKFT
jgi:hypothetical protein